MRALLIVVVLSLLSTPARAGDGDAPAEDPAATKARTKQALEYYKVGREAVNKGQFTVAITAFEEAYRLLPERASVTFALGLAYRKQWLIDRDPAKLKRAVTLFQQVMTLSEDDTKEARKPKASEYLLELEPKLAEAEAEQADAGAGPLVEASAERHTALILSSKVPGTMVRFDDEKEGVATPVVKRTTPGAHRVAAYADGYYTSSQEVIAIEGETLPFELFLDERPATLIVNSDAGAEVVVDGQAIGRAGDKLSVSAGTHLIAVVASGRHAWVRRYELERGGELTIEAPLRTTRKRRAVWWVAGGAGVLLFVGAAATAGALAAESEAEGYEDEIDAGIPLTPDDREAHNDAIDRRDTWRSAALWLFAGTGLAALAATYLYVTDDPQVFRENVGVAIVPGGAMGSLAWTF